MASRGLGKGLNALISENYVQPAAAAKAADSAVGDIHTLPINKIHAGKYQPRSQFEETALKELADSIKKNGVLQPVLVRPSDKHPNKFEIVAGERRWRAAKLASVAVIPVIVREINDQQALELALVENIQRQDLSVLEEAKGYQRLIEEFKYTQEKLASTIGKSRSHVANIIRLLTLPEEVKKMIDKGELTAGHARSLIGAKNAVELAKQIVKGGLNVRETEDETRKAKGKSKKPKKPSSSASVPSGKPKDADILALEESLSDNLGLKVSINDRGQSGEIIIAYDSLKQLDDVLKRLSSNI